MQALSTALAREETALAQARALQAKILAIVHENEQLHAVAARMQDVVEELRSELAHAHIHLRSELADGESMQEYCILLQQGLCRHKS